MKTIVKLISAALIIMMVCTGISAAAGVASGMCGDNLTWSLDDAGKLTISGTGAMIDWSSPDRVPWYSHRDDIRSVEIGGNITTIGANAFAGCRQLTSVTIPDGVTVIGERGFMNCGITTITMPNSVTDIGAEAFRDCSHLTSVTVQDNVESIGDMAFCSSSLTGIIVSGSNRYFCSVDGVLFSRDKTELICYPAGKAAIVYDVPSSVTSIGCHAFDGCMDLTSVTIPDSVTEIGNDAFAGCTGLTSITIPDSITVLGDNLFNNCRNLGSVTIPDSVTEIGDMTFGACTSLRSVTIPWGVQRIGTSTFFGCTGLASVTIPDSVRYIGNYAFYNCSSLTSVKFESKTTAIYDSGDTIPPTATIYGYAGSTAGIYADKYEREFALIVKITESGTCGENVGWELDDTGKLTVSGKGAMTDWKEVDDAPWNSRRDGIISVEIGSGVTGIGANSFCNCGHLTSIVISDTVTSIGENAFGGCTGLATVSIPSGVTHIGNESFCGCTNLAAVAISDSVTSIGDRAFCGCTSLVSVNVPSSVTEIGYEAFFGCSVLRSITVPSSVTVIGGHAFGDCARLVDITVDSVNKYYCSVDGVLFNKNQTELICYPAGKTEEMFEVASGVKHIGNYAFNNCDHLSGVRIESKTTVIYDSRYSIDEELTIYGYVGSTAEVYAEKYSRKFIIIDETDVKIVATGMCGIGLTWTLDDAGKLTISGTGPMSGYTTQWFSYRNSIRSVKIGSGVTSIGENAFDGCTHLTSVTIPNNVLSVGNYAFDNCTGLELIWFESKTTSIFDSSYTIPSNATIYGYLGSTAEAYATKQKKKFMSIDDPNAVISASGTCGNNLNWELDDAGKLTISGTGAMTNWDDPAGVPWDARRDVIRSVEIGAGVTGIGKYAFYNCPSLKSVTIPDSVTQIGNWAFYCCADLMTVTLPDGVTSIGNAAFLGCTGLSYFVIPKNVHTIAEGTFSYCTGLVSVGIPDGVETIYGDAFSYCTSLISVTISDSVSYIGRYAFCDCSSLKSVTIPSGVKGMAYGAFAGCTSLTSIRFESAYTEIDDSDDTITSGATIYGHSDSTAEDYAKKHDRTFISVDVSYTEATTYTDVTTSSAETTAELTVVTADATTEATTITTPSAEITTAETLTTTEATAEAASSTDATTSIPAGNGCIATVGISTCAVLAVAMLVMCALIEKKK
ncbi:MAG: leucine-rich repeat domain-containing protein [Clostridia bacterium]|nr:leucine-rich repeat domain-containing protein [Clostridia bacterium]